LGRKIQAPEGWKLTSNAVFEVKEKKEDIDYLPLCGPLWVVGLTNGAHGEWGMVLAFLDRDGCAHRLAIPASRLHEDSTILARELASLGLRTVPGREKRLVAYVAMWEVEARILSAKRLGWLEDPAGALSFVMPDRVIAGDGTREVVFQPDRYSPTVRTVHAAGSLDEWKALIAAPASRHPPMLFALSAGLAPALLAFAEAGDSFLVHFWGSTSRGKTTLGQIAASPWGCAADPNDAPSLTFVRRWNVTGNGLEGLAEAHSDLPLVLDELGAATIGDIRPLVYQVSGGQGKTALNSARELKEPRSWRTIVVSTGELSIHARMSDPDGDGTRTRPVKGGLTHRALDIEVSDIAAAAPAAEREALVSGIKVACAHHYGAAGPELAHLIADRFATAGEARAYVREQVAVVTADIVPQRLAAETLRAVRRFALIAVAGELAVEFGLIPATTDQVRQAAREVVNHWLGAAAETDEQRIVVSVRAFLLKHESRFQRITDSDVVQNRVGFVDRADGRWMFTNAGLIEAAPGYDRTSIARALRKAGYLHTNSDKLTVPVTVDGRRTRLYVIKAGIFEDEEKGALPAEMGVQGVHGVSAQQPHGFEAAHPPENQGVQGVHRPPPPGAAAHPAHPDDDPGVHPSGRATTGLAHHAHRAHRNIGVGESFSQAGVPDEEVF